MKQSTKEYRARRRWFLSMVGRRVWPNYTECECDLCLGSKRDGIALDNITDALAFFQDERKNVGMKYYATEKERDEAELNDNLKLG